MRAKLRLVLVSVLLLTSCSQKSAPTYSSTDSKIDGPPVASLSHADLLRIYGECTQFGRMDDSHVKYTEAYCSSVNHMQQIEGYAYTTPRSVNSDPVKMH